MLNFKKNLKTQGARAAILNVRKAPFFVWRQNLMPSGKIGPRNPLPASSLDLQLS